MTLIACNKEVNVDTPTFSHRVTIHAAQPETKTVINEGASSATFTWSADDASRFYITENDVAGTGVSITSTDGYATMTLGATFETATADSYVYKAVLAKNLTSSKKPRVPNSQTSSATSYDPNADVLVAKDLTFDDPQDEFSMQFMRPVVINKMTLKGLTEGETITTVTIKSDAEFIGYYDASSEKWTKDGDEIIVTVNQTVPSSGQIVVYFVTAPIEGATLTVTADTEDYTYSKSFTKTIDLIAGQVTVFGVSSLSKVAKPNLAGNYLIVSKDNENHPWALMSTCSGTVYSGVSTEIANSTAIDLTDATINLNDFRIDDYVWTLAKVAGGYTLQSAKTGKYVTIEKDSNEARESNTALTLSVTNEGSNQFKVMEAVSGNNRILQYNYNGGDLRFAFYKNSQNDVYFVPVTTWKTRLATPANLAATTSGSTINVSWDAVDNASGYLVTCTGQSDQNIAVGTLSTSFTGLADGDYTITVKALGSGDYATSLANTASVAIGSLKITWNGTVNPATVSTGYSVTYNGTDKYPVAKTGYYQDAGTKNSTINYIVVSSPTPIFTSTPSGVTLKATLGGGSIKNPLDYNVYTCLVDSNGDEISSTVTTVTTKITNTNGSDFEVSIPVTGVSSAYGFKVRHMKEDGWNVRYYGLTLTVESGSSSGSDVTWNLESIAVTTVPTKTEYYVGQSFDPTGMVVTGHFVDAADDTHTKNEVVTDYTISPNGALDLTDDHVTITYQGKSTTQAITVTSGFSVTATFNGKNETYTDGWTTTGTGKTRTDCVVIGKDENITSPVFDLSGYSNVTITFTGRRFGSLTGSKATVDASIGGSSMGTIDITNGSVGAVSGSISFTPTTAMTSAVIVFTCTNATSPGSTHGAGIGSITITAN